MSTTQSTDGTAAIADAYCRDDARIRIRRFEEHVDANASISRAYRVGAELGEWCKALLADDRLVEPCLERMVEVGERSPSVGVVGSYRLNGKVVDLDGLPCDVAVSSGLTILRYALQGGPYVTGTPTTLLFRSALVREREPFYDLSFWHADTDAAYWALARSDFGFVHEVLTFTRRQGGTRSDWAEDINSHIPENVRFVLRYGERALEPAAYRAAVRRELGKYLEYHFKRRVRPWIVKPAGFRAFHLAQIDRIRVEGDGDRTVAAGARLAQTLVGGREEPAPGAD